MSFEIGKRYQATAITDNKSYGIYDQLIALIDGKLEYLTDWHSDEMEHRIELAKEYGVEVTEQEVYDEAFKEIINMIPVTYEDAKEVYVFKGVTPHGRGFDVYTTYDCVAKEIYGQK